MLASSLFLASGSAFLAARPSAHSILPGRLSASPTMGLSDGLEPSLRAGMSAASSKMAFGPPGRVLGGAASAWVLLFNADQPDEVSSKLLSSLPHATAQLLAVTATHSLHRRREADAAAQFLTVGSCSGRLYDAEPAARPRPPHLPGELCGPRRRRHFRLAARGTSLPRHVADTSETLTDTFAPFHEADSRDAASPAAAPAQWSASQLQTLCHAARFQLAHLPAGAT